MLNNKSISNKKLIAPIICALLSLMFIFVPFIISISTDLCGKLIITQTENYYEPEWGRAIPFLLFLFFSLICTIILMLKWTIKKKTTNIMLKVSFVFQIISIIFILFSMISLLFIDFPSVDVADKPILPIIMSSISLIATAINVSYFIKGIGNEKK